MLGSNSRPFLQWVVSPVLAAVAPAAPVPVPAAPPTPQNTLGVVVYRVFPLEGPPAGVGGGGGNLVPPPPPMGAAGGSCATGAREPSQGRKAAALSGPSCVPQASLPVAPIGGA